MRSFWRRCGGWGESVTFEPQNDLERALIRAAHDPSQRPAFAPLLLETNLFVIGEGSWDPTAPKMRTAEEGDSMSLRKMQWQGKHVLPVFSSLPRLQAFLREEAGYLSMKSVDLMQATLGTDMILNPGSEYGKELLAKEIASLLDGSYWQPQERIVITSPQTIQIGQPAIYPTELAVALRRTFARFGEVKRAFLAHYHNSSDGLPPHTLIALETTGDPASAIAQAGVVVKSIDVPHPPVDFIQLSDDGFGEHIRRDFQPFYTKKSFGWF